ncbi:hypothetical protein IV04_15915 [Serratia sp. Ag1]|nr:hypothetical protein JV45_03545 [Serratia sp. Ag2]KFK97352.1 hypothetical protein IV04_15915 [Serratia sp. Ag1]
MSQDASVLLIINGKSAGNEENSSVIDASLPWLEISAPHEITFNLDGEPLKGKHFRIELLPGAIKCRLPPNCDLLGQPRSTLI